MDNARTASYTLEVKIMDNLVQVISVKKIRSSRKMEHAKIANLTLSLLRMENIVK